MEFEKPAYGLGGGSFSLYFIRNVVLSFKTDENKIERIDFPKLHVSICKKKTEKVKAISERLPSIIGTDFLTNNGFILYADIKKKKAYLEKE